MDSHFRGNDSVWGMCHSHESGNPLLYRIHVIQVVIYMNFHRITVNPNQMGGVPCIRGLRIPVATVVDMVADGMTEEEILNAYPDLEAEDIRESLRYAAEALREREIPLVTIS